MMRLIGAAVVVLGVFFTATAVREADQVVASGREVLLGGRLVDLFSARDVVIDGHAELAGTAVALGDLDVATGSSLRVDRHSSRVFAVGGAVTVSENASVIFPESGGLKYGTIRTGAVGSRDTVLRDPGAVSQYAEMVSSLEASSICFGRAASTGIVESSRSGVTLIGDGVSGLQVFHIDRVFAGTITFSRIPTDASILLNLTGPDVVVGPRGDDWLAASEHALVNVADAATVAIEAGDGLRANVLVGSTDGAVTISGSRFVGSMLSMSDVTVTDTRLEHGSFLATALPECGPKLSTEPAATSPIDTRSVGSESSTSSTTTTTTTTTTTVLSGNQPRGAAPVPGAAFALGGAATSGRWWLGVPLSMAGVVLICWVSIVARYRERLEQIRRRQLPVSAQQRLLALQVRR